MCLPVSRISKARRCLALTKGIDTNYIPSSYIAELFAIHKPKSTDNELARSLAVTADRG